jgi:hypothetical protein
MAVLTHIFKVRDCPSAFCVYSRCSAKATTTAIHILTLSLNSSHGRSYILAPLAGAVKTHGCVFVLVFCLRRYMCCTDQQTDFQNSPPLDTQPGDSLLLRTATTQCACALRFSLAHQNCILLHERAFVKPQFRFSCLTFLCHSRLPVSAWLPGIKSR